MTRVQLSAEAAGKAGLKDQEIEAEIVNFR